MKFFIPCIFLLLMVSCGVIPRNYPANKPFVYQTNIKLEGNFKTDEKNDLETRLNSQLHDSIRVRTVRKWLFFRYLPNPPVYDSLNADKSVLFMKALMNSLGYFSDSIHYDTTLNVVKGDPVQLQTTVDFYVKPNKVTRLDSLSWVIIDTMNVAMTSELQKLTDSTLNQSFLKKDEPFAKPVVSAELNRLVDLYRNSGYFRFSFDDLVGIWDTVAAALLRPAIDPFEQIRLLEEIRKRRENPTADLQIRLKPGYDSTRLVKYFVGKTIIYTDFREDSASYERHQVIVDSSFTVIYYQDFFKPKLLPENIYFKRGDVYSQRNYVRTINRFNSLGAWRLVSIEQLPRVGTDSIDFIMRLTPADKFSFGADLEGSFNNNALSGNLFGIGVNVGLTNRNFAKASNQASTNLRFGTELGLRREENFVQTRQLSLGHTIYFPRAVPRGVSRFISKFSFIPDELPDNVRTIFSFNLANTERLLLFTLNTINASWGYEMAWKNKLVNLRIPNIEFNFLDQKDSLIKLIAQNPSLGYIFNEGLVISGGPSFTITGGKKDMVNSLRINYEQSGIIPGGVRTKFLDSNLYRFIKVDADARTLLTRGKSGFAFRIFAGLGVPFSRNPDKNRSLPFFKQYFAGGPNSMRAWGIRRLGPGSTMKTFDVDPLRFGDVQFEANAEYRFFLVNIAGVKLHSALYVDIGNVWFIKERDDYPEGTFQFKNFFRDLAVGTGTGLRIDFDLFLLRLDYAFKVRDPSPEPANMVSQHKWFYNWRWKTFLDGELQIGINYPF